MNKIAIQNNAKMLGVGFLTGVCASFIFVVRLIYVLEDKL